MTEEQVIQSYILRQKEVILLIIEMGLILADISVPDVENLLCESAFAHKNHSNARVD